MKSGLCIDCELEMMLLKVQRQIFERDLVEVERVLLGRSKVTREPGRQVELLSQGANRYEPLGESAPDQQATHTHQNTSEEDIA